MASGPSGMPRLAGQSEGRPATGLEFIASRYDTIANVSEPASVPGDARVTFGPVPLNEVWRVERIAINSDSVQPTIATIYLGSVDRRNQIDQTGSGNSDLADNINPILIPSGQLLIVDWKVASQGALCFARIQFWAGRLDHVQVG